MKVVPLLAVCAGLATPALATLTYTGGTIMENFDSLPTTNTTGAFSNVVGTQSPVPGLVTWSGTKNAGTGATASTFIADNGTSNSGALFSYGQTGNTDRALGALASGSNAMTFGVDIVNNSGLTWADVTITFTKEQYRSSTSTQNVLSFAYGLSGGTATGSNFLTDTSLAPLATGNVVGDAPVATNGRLDPISTAPVSFTITGVNWAPGQTLFIRWSDFNDIGNDAGLAIDDFSLTGVPSPGSVALVGLAGLAAIRRRRA